MGEIEQANRLADESLALFRESGDKAGMAWVLADKGMHAVGRGDYAQAKVLGDEGATLFREVSDLRGLAWALRASAGAEGALGNTTQSVLLYNEGITASQAAGDDANAAMCNMGLGGLAYDAGDYEHADALFQQAMTLSLKSGDADGVGYVLLGLAGTSLVQGDLERAASQFEASETQFRQTQQRHGLACVLSNLGYVRHLQGDDRAARALLREAIALQQQQQLKSSLIRTIEWCACISADILQPQRAARLFGAAEAARERLWGSPLTPGEKPLFDRHLERARAELDKPTFDVAWAEGRALTLDQAVESALEMPLAPEEGVHRRPTRRAAKKEFDGLTGREREIAVRIAQGESNREIAEGLVVSERTVETHVTNILNKLGFSSRAQIRKWAVDKRLVKRVE
jgi:ATP/maltotriose-dependent transcriptional regulator MalT